MNPSGVPRLLRGPRLWGSWRIFPLPPTSYPLSADPFSPDPLSLPLPVAHTINTTPPSKTTTIPYASRIPTMSASRPAPAAAPGWRAGSQGGPRPAWTVPAVRNADRHESSSGYRPATPRPVTNNPASPAGRHGLSRRAANPPAATRTSRSPPVHRKTLHQPAGRPASRRSSPPGTR